MTDPVCPKCGSEDYIAQHHEFSTEGGPNLPDCSWMFCLDCEYRSEPE